jgi:hypothetical protein
MAEPGLEPPRRQGARDDDIASGPGGRLRLLSGDCVGFIDLGVLASWRFKNSFNFPNLAPT